MNADYFVEREFSGAGLVKPVFKRGDGFTVGAIVTLDEAKQGDVLQAWTLGGFLSKAPALGRHNLED